MPVNSVGLLGFKLDLTVADMTGGGVGMGRGWFGGVGGDSGQQGAMGVVESLSDKSGTSGWGSRGSLAACWAAKCIWWSQGILQWLLGRDVRSSKLHGHHSNSTRCLWTSSKSEVGMGWCMEVWIWWRVVLPSSEMRKPQWFWLRRDACSNVRN